MRNFLVPIVILFSLNTCEYVKSPEVSVYDKNVDFGLVSSDYYIGQHSNYEFGGRDSKCSEIYRQFDSLVDDTYFSKEYIGRASDGSEMFMYKLSPMRPIFSGSASNKRNKNMPKFIIVCGQHGFEKSSIYGTLYFIKDLCCNYKECSILKYFRQYVEFILIPCANPHGINNNQYLNYNGVNLNRNWPVDNWTSDSSQNPGDSYYCGAKPGDQLEVKNIINVLNDNADALMVVDFHTNGMANQSKGSLNWLSMSLPNDPYRDILIDIGYYHLCNISTAFEFMYPDEVGKEDTLCGYMDGADYFSTTGYLSTYCAQHNFLSITFEGFNGFPAEPITYSEKTKKANSELLGNYLNTVCWILSTYNN